MLSMRPTWRINDITSITSPASKLICMRYGFPAIRFCAIRTSFGLPTQTVIRSSPPSTLPSITWTTGPGYAPTRPRDKFGNLTLMKVYDYNDESHPARTYTNTYYQPGNYINNRLLTSTITPYGG